MTRKELPQAGLTLMIYAHACTLHTRLACLLFHPGYDWHTLGSLQTKIKTYPTLYDKDYCITTDDKHCFEPFQPIPLPFVRDSKHRVLYCITEYDPLMDSCNMNMDDWAKLARDIEKHYEQFDGFVILHGTDTMCYTASALSFMLENLGKPVILTGAQLPLSETRSDAHGNMLGALLMAGSGYAHIPEVCIYFGHQLLRGNRTSKTSATSFSPYSSPNLPTLATLGMNVSIAGHHARCRDLKFKAHSAMCPDVGTLTLFPGMTPQLVETFLQPPLKGAVLQTYGAGHFPTQRPLLDKVAQACGRGVVVVNCSQCPHGTTHTASEELCELGVVSGADLTVEAALTKLSFLLGQTHLSVHDVRKVTTIA
ncbi:60 kDa lysophospholipase [Geodia barretti]|uniref:asparaginase n=1 Tax=Geodia barretti TaxID=519541 RepID=A0AA35WMP8_GEOBA|nr:60 kDa lysophospholipase [Geodia barretti]